MSYNIAYVLQYSWFFTIQLMSYNIAYVLFYVLRLFWGYRYHKCSVEAFVNAGLHVFSIFVCLHFQLLKVCFAFLMVLTNRCKFYCIYNAHWIISAAPDWFNLCLRFSYLLSYFSFRNKENKKVQGVICTLARHHTSTCSVTCQL